MDWTLEDNMVDGLFFCATLTGRRGGHTPAVQQSLATKRLLRIANMSSPKKPDLVPKKASYKPAYRNTHTKHA